MNRDFETFNKLYEEGQRFFEAQNVQFIESFEDGFISGFTFEAIQKGKVTFSLDGITVTPEMIEKALNYFAFQKTL